MTDTSTSNTQIAAFNNSSENVFIGSQISLVGGDSINNRYEHHHYHQYSYHDHYHDQGSSSSIPIQSSSESVFDDFYTIKRANLFMIKEICNERTYTTVTRRTSSTAAAPGSGPLKTTDTDLDNSLTAVKTYNLVRIRGHREIDSQTDFTSATYTGPGALVAWKHDFDFFSQYQHPLIAQLFGLTRSLTPALLFHHELIPLRKAQGYLRSFPLLARSYLRYRETVDGREGGKVVHITGVGIHAGGNNLWLNPQNHHFCIGPEGPRTGSGPYLFTTEGHPFKDEPLPFQNYFSVPSVLQHFKMFGIDPFAFLADQGFYNYSGNWDMRCYLEYIPAGAIVVEVNDDYAVVGHFPGFHYRPLYLMDNQVDVGDWISMQITREDLVQGFQKQIAYIIHDKSVDTIWLAQANYIVESFFQMYRDSEFVHIRWLDLDIKSRILPAGSDVNNTPDPTEGPSVFLLCSKVVGPEEYGPKYFWSFDPLGTIPIPSETRILAALSIPDIEFGFQCSGHRFEKELYSELAQSHDSMGFDPKTQDLAKARGYALFEQREEIKFMPMPENMDDFIEF